MCMHCLRQGKHGLSVGFNLINECTQLFLLGFVLTYDFRCKTETKKIWSDNFYTFQSRVEITGPNIDINKIAQADKDKDEILGFKSVNP